MSHLTFALLAMATRPALAWEHTGFAWAAEDRPFEWRLQADPADPYLTPEEQAAAVERAFATWEAAAPCVGPLAVRGDDIDLGELSADRDDLNTVRFGDPEEDLGYDIDAISYLYSSGASSDAGTMLDPQTDEERAYVWVSESDIVFSDHTAWITLDQVASDGCSGDYVIESMALRFTGHMLGLAPTCVDGADCDDAELAATMYWDHDACDTDRANLSADDVDSLLALYSPLGPAPVVTRDGSHYSNEVCLSVKAIHGLDETIHWQLGDGSSATGREVCHTYSEPGVYTVSAEAEESGCEAPTFAEVLACDTLAVPAGQDHAFTLDVDGTMASVVLGDVMGLTECIEEIAWAMVDDSTGLSYDDAFGPTGQLSAGGPGSWTVTLTVTALDQVLEDAISFTIDGEGDSGSTDSGSTDSGSADSGSADDDGKDGGCGCSAPAAPPAALLALLAPLLALRRRYPQ